jgi:hypothetical protein
VLTSEAMRDGVLLPASDLDVTERTDILRDLRLGASCSPPQLLWHMGSRARAAAATPEEIMEAIWVAAEMRAGGAYAHASAALHALREED